jgi:hypothetical protein
LRSSLTLGTGGIKKRDLEDVLKTNHNKTDFGYTPTTPADVLFEGANSCVLTPEVILGPYCKIKDAMLVENLPG